MTEQLGPELTSMVREESVRLALQVADHQGIRVSLSGILAAADTISKFVIKGDVPVPPGATDGPSAPEPDYESDGSDEFRTWGEELAALFSGAIDTATSAAALLRQLNNEGK